MKHLSQSANQTVNVLHTIAKREKLMASLEKCPGAQSEEFKKSNEIFFFNLPLDTLEFVTQNFPDFNDYVYFKTLTMCGHVFRADSMSCIVHGLPRDPYISRIVYFAEHRSSKQIKIISQRINGTLLPHLSLFCAEVTSFCDIVQPEEIVLGRPLNLYHVKNHSGEDVICFALL